ncbi:MAG: hypothetical protein IPJ71_00220 [Bdellovibrionales bacterium]|nr:hypothetical protein [Bdellovibrionales bacterium]
MKQIRICLHFGFFILFLLGCEGGVPEFSELGSNRIPNPTFSGKSTTTITLTSPTQTIVLSGECDQRVQDIEVQFKDLSQWAGASEFSVAPPSLNCEKSSHSFSINLKGLTQLGFWGQLTQPLTFQIGLRSSTKIGPSGASTVNVLYRPVDSGKAPLGNVSSGSGSTSSGNYKLDARISFGNTQPSSSPNYRIEGSTVR